VMKRQPRCIASARQTRLVIAAALVVSGIAAVHARDAPAMIEDYGCNICHSDRETMAGPAWVDVAVKYRGNPNATAVIVAVMKKGKHGGGPWPMPPLPEVSDADAHVIARYILKQRP
jgi:cytochrome c